MDPILKTAVTPGGRCPIDIANEFAAVAKTVEARKRRMTGDGAQAYNTRMDDILRACALACTQEENRQLLVTGAEALTAAEAALEQARQDLADSLPEFLAGDALSKGQAAEPVHQVVEVGAAISVPFAANAA